MSKQRLQQNCVIALAVLMSWAAAAEPPEPIPVKVVVVTMFEVGADEGDRAGEFQLWKERRNLTKTFPFMGYRDLYLDPEKGLLVLVTGIGTARSAAAIMALGMDPRFDLTKSYWVVAGIAGFDPEDASIGSAAWAEYLVDGIFPTKLMPVKFRRIGPSVILRGIPSAPLMWISLPQREKCISSTRAW